MEIAFLVSRSDKPSTKFRIKSYLPLLAEEGISATVFPLSRKILGRWKIFHYLNKYDLVLIQKKLFSFAELAYIRRRSRRLVYDFDDAVMFKGGENLNPANPLRQKRFYKTVRFCDWIIAGNSYLQKEAGVPSDRISVLPTPVDTDKYLPQKKNNSGEKITIGWLGSKSTVNYLKPLIPVFSELRAKFPGLKIKLISDGFQGIEGLGAIQKIWKEEEEISDLHSFDIGIMPLPNDPWTNGKCGFKLLQYQAVGLPVICSPVGINQEIVTDNVNGFLADTPQEWIEKLNHLISSSGSRIRMGKTGRKRMVERYSLKAIWPHFFSLLKRVTTIADR